MYVSLFWRTLASAYLRTFFLSVGSFLAILFVLRFKEIARFTALSGGWGKTVLFTVYQFPLIFPIAIPLSAFLASFLLIQRMSHTSELLAFRACGFSFLKLFSPLLYLSTLLSLLNFSITADLAPYCRYASKLMLTRETTENPLLLLQRQKLVKLKHAYLSMNTEEEGKRAKDLLLITYHDKTERLNLIWAPSLILDGDDLIGQNLASVTHLPTEEGSFDSLLIENQETLTTEAQILSPLLKKSHSRIETISLPFRMLLLNPKKFAFVELFRRCSLSLAVFNFTLLGAVFGVELGRISKRSFLKPFTLILLTLVGYLVAKELKSISCLFFPHLLTWLCCAIRLRTLNRGIP